MQITDSDKALIGSFVSAVLAIGVPVAKAVVDGLAAGRTLDAILADLEAKDAALDPALAQLKKSVAEQQAEADAERARATKPNETAVATKVPVPTGNGDGPMR